MISDIDEWQFKFNTYIHKWGIHNLKDYNEYYQCINLFRFKKSSLLCLLSCIEGFKKLLLYFNGKFNENAVLEIVNNRCDLNSFEEIENKLMKGEISIETARNYIFNY